MKPRTGTKVGRNPVRTTPDGSTNSSVFPPFLVIPSGRRPSQFHPILTLSPFARGRGGVKTYRCWRSSGLYALPFIYHSRWSQPKPPVTGVRVSVESSPFTSVKGAAPESQRRPGATFTPTSARPRSGDGRLNQALRFLAR